MSEEKVRSSNEGERPDVSAPILPTVNPTVVEAAPKKSAGIPSYVYIAYVLGIAQQSEQN